MTVISLTVYMYFAPPFAVSGDEDREDGGAGVRGVP